MYVVEGRRLSVFTGNYSRQSRFGCNLIRNKEGQLHSRRVAGDMLVADLGRS
jgi:hypothetical protein